jgi:hypothetical protein
MPRQSFIELTRTCAHTQYTLSVWGEFVCIPMRRYAGHMSKFECLTIEKNRCFSLFCSVVQESQYTLIYLELSSSCYILYITILLCVYKYS